MMHFTAEQLADRWMDRREIQNMMGKFVYCKLLKREKYIFDTFWANRDDICLGINEGWFKGREEVRRYYQESFAITEAKSSHMQKLYNGFLGDVEPERLHGVGSVNIDALTTCILEQSEDGETAQGLWYVVGVDNDLFPNGPYSLWGYGYMSADFIREGDDWKLWHLRDIVDIGTPVGKDWAGDCGMPEPVEKYAALAELKPPKPGIEEPIREKYYPTRKFTPLVEFLPRPYVSFAETTSYGI